MPRRGRGARAPWRRERASAKSPAARPALPPAPSWPGSLGRLHVGALRLEDDAGSLGRDQIRGHDSRDVVDGHGVPTVFEPEELLVVAEDDLEVAELVRLAAGRLEAFHELHTKLPLGAAELL